jgi:hypothetical protein
MEALMSRRIHALYRWAGNPGEISLERVGDISSARLRAWEYHQTAEKPWAFVSGPVRDTVREWKTARPDLRIPVTLLVGEQEESSGVSS